MKHPKQLCVLHLEDSKVYARQIRDLLRRQGCEVVTASTVADAWAEYRRRRFDLIIVDLRLRAFEVGQPPDRGGLEFLCMVRRAHDTTPAVLLSALAATSDVSLATVLGIRLFLEKDHDESRRQLVDLVGRLASGQPSEAAVDATLAEPRIGDIALVHEVTGTSAAAKELRQSIEMIALAPERLVVLITGDTGTGKDRCARAIHRLSPSPRCDRPFEAFNCTEAPAGLFESTLFGHEKGSFTGASARQPGRFELASDGTLFLDEIGEVPLTEQPKLLRALETRSYRPLGAKEQRPILARIIAATNRDLEAMVEAGTFRADLYHRLHGLRLHLPSLAERKDDVATIIHETVAEVAPRRHLSREALDALVAMQWPGNVRELRSTIESMFSLSCSRTIDMEDVERVLGNRCPPTFREWRIRALAADIMALGGLEALRAIEATMVAMKLEETDGNRTRAGQALGLSRKQVARRAAGTKTEAGSGVAARVRSGVFLRAVDEPSTTDPRRKLR